MMVLQRSNAGACKRWSTGIDHHQHSTTANSTVSAYGVGDEMVVEHGRNARVSRCRTPLYCVSGRAPRHCSARRSESRAPKNCAAWTAPARILRRTAAWKKSEGTCRGSTAWPARPDFGRRHAPMGGSCRRPGAALRRRVVEERYVPPCDLESRQYKGPNPLQ